MDPILCLSVITKKTKTGKKNEHQAVDNKFGLVLNRLATSFEASTNLTFKSEHLHVLFLNSDQHVRNQNINFSVNCFWDLETIGIREKEKLILLDFQDPVY